MKKLQTKPRAFKQWSILAIAICGLMFLCLQSCQNTEALRSPNVDSSLQDLTLKVTQVPEPIQPIPLEIVLNPQKVELGKRLFHDTSLSGDGKVACATCHKLSMGGVDRKMKSIGMNNVMTERNTSTVFNSGFNFKQGWDGKAATLEEVVELVINDPTMMSNSWTAIVQHLKQETNYEQAFRQVYDNGITSENIKDAIATFTRSLYTPNSRFDRYLRGQQDAISDEEKAGYKLFKDYGCASCHQGVNVGGNLFQKFGVTENYFKVHGNPSKPDLGRSNVTGSEADRYVFKVPSLRNIALTEPYLHNGWAKTLAEAIDIMADYQLGRVLPKKDSDSIVQFLNTLTGEYQGKPL
ncbi:Cytochrome c551 peroxidase [Tumidithrix helvetica PCC 7403]|uniref:cytochrome-c peroxidase n=1 Tax=Tumidithrix helvetica TaxID=3457545 RepID=UPI003C8CB262